MTCNHQRAIIVVSLAALIAAACNECATGSETCACTAGGACDDGLVCLSDLCVDPGGGHADTGGDADAGGDADGDSDGPRVPTPCPEVPDNLFHGYAEVEPNDFPEQATDACSASTEGSDEDGWSAQNPRVRGQLGGDDLVDYFVFRTVDDEKDQLVMAAIEWDSDVNLADIRVFRVDDGHQGAEVYASANTDGWEEGGDISLPAGTVYLLEIRVPDSANPPPATEYIYGL